MPQSLVPVILLATVALSSSNVLLSIDQFDSKPIGFSSQYDDNTISNRFHSRHFLNNILCRQIVGTSKNDQLSILCKTLQLQDIDEDNNEANDIVKNEGSYNGEGFRQEQWHNYPRQLDRLHKYFNGLLDDDDKRHSIPDDPDHYKGNEDVKYDSINDIITNQILLNNNNDVQHMYDAVIAATSPLLILKIQLAYLNNNIEKVDKLKYPELVLQQFPGGNLENEQSKIMANDINPSMNVIKVKREFTPDSQDVAVSDDSGDIKKKAVKKRIFSLWSRLQSLSHKGHELHHRRHLHAFYGLPDAEGSGALTAETRATFMRPPGSPLRWG